MNPSPHPVLEHFQSSQNGSSCVLWSHSQPPAPIPGNHKSSITTDLPTLVFSYKFVDFCIWLFTQHNVFEVPPWHLWHASGVHSFYNWIVGHMASLYFAYPVISWWTRVQFLVLWLLWITLLWTLIYSVSPLHMNLQVANFQRCEHAFHQCQVWETLQPALCLLLLTIHQLYHLPPPLPPPGSSSSYLFTWCQTLYASCYPVLLYFSGFCTVRLKCFIFVCFYVLFVWKVL